MPAAVKPGWKLPPPPVVGAVPSYYLDNGDCQLWWVIPTVEAYDLVQQDGEIEWPFTDDYAYKCDLDPLGFYDLEDLPAVE